MNRFERCANERSSTTLPPTALSRLVMTEMTPRTGRCSGKRDSCDSLEPLLSSRWPRAQAAHSGTLRAGATQRRSAESHRPRSEGTARWTMSVLTATDRVIHCHKPGCFQKRVVGSSVSVDNGGHKGENRSPQKGGMSDTAQSSS